MLALRIKIEKEKRRRQITNSAALSPYRFDPAAYFRDKFQWSPWSGTAEQPGQQQIIDAYVLALRQQLEQREYEAGRLTAEQLQYWQPGQEIQYCIHVEAGHTVGKTRLAAGLLSHFFDHFSPSVIYSFAPTWGQIKKLLWKEVRADRKGRLDLPGRVTDGCEIIDDQHPDHFAVGMATTDAGGKGTERVQGQHEEYQFYIVDEAEGVADFVFNALDSMTSGGISIILMLANPRTRTSRFHKHQARPEVKSFRISCLSHPNVIQDRELIPGAVRRKYVNSMIFNHCEEVTEHDAENFTFEVPWHPGKIWLPDAEFMFRVLGVPPLTTSDRCLIPVGRYEAAIKREPVSDRSDLAWIGVDCARFGSDSGTIYVRHDGAVWRHKKISKLATQDYTDAIETLCFELFRKGVKKIRGRVDAGGGFGSGIIDNLRINQRMRDLFELWLWVEVAFGGTAKDATKYFDKITELTADAGESLKGLAILNPPNELQSDLTERLFDYRNKGGIEVKKLEEKSDFRKRLNHSPDDGDGFILAIASDSLITLTPTSALGVISQGKTRGW